MGLGRCQWQLHPLSGHEDQAAGRPIGDAALALIAAQPRRDGCAYVFPGDFANDRFIGMPRILQRICASVGIEGITPHALRHTFASFAGELGFSELSIAALLGHVSRGITQRYVHIDKAVRLAVNEVSAHLAGYLGVPQSPDAGALLSHATGQFQSDFNR